MITFEFHNVPIKGFSIDCYETKTNESILANHKGHRQYSEPIKTQSSYRYM